MKERIYLAIDLKSFYASVECVERELDPLNTNLLVADHRRTDKTICLAVSPSLKSYGIGGRPRLFEVIQKVRDINGLRLSKISKRAFLGKSYYHDELRARPDFALDYIVAPPRMAHYIDYSAKIYEIYLRYISKDDIHIYSIDEVFMDITDYLKGYGIGARELARRILLDVLKDTKIPARAGIGTNLYLAKIAMDIMAKKIDQDEDGLEIAFLDGMEYRRKLWNHRPITDFWRIGKGYARRLEGLGLYTMGDIARTSLGKAQDYHNEDLLYRVFGVNAELLIDHAWGEEYASLEDIKKYKPEAKSISTSQVLHAPYKYKELRIIVWEMLDLLALDLLAKGVFTNQIVIRIGYDRESLLDPNIKDYYEGEIVLDSYGRKKPKSVVGRVNFDKHTASSKDILTKVLGTFDHIVDKKLLARRVSLSANNILSKEDLSQMDRSEQLSLFDSSSLNYLEGEEEELKEKILQETFIEIKSKYGKNAILKGVNLLDGATTMDRNRQIGGHRA